MRLQSQSHRRVTSRTRCELFCCSGFGLTGSMGHLWLTFPGYQACSPGSGQLGESE